MYLRIGGMADLEEAIQLAQEAIDATPEDHPALTGRLNTLGVRLGDRYSRTEAMTDSEEVKYLNSLSKNFSTRYERRGKLKDLTQVIEYSQVAVDLTLAGSPAQAGYFNDLSCHISIWYEIEERLQGLKTQTEEALYTQANIKNSHSFSQKNLTSQSSHPAEGALPLQKQTPEFADFAYGTASNGQGVHRKTIRPVELVSEEQVADDTRTEYSELSTASSVMRTYMQDLADDLFSIMYRPQTDPKHMHRFCEILTGLLQQFAFRVGQEVPSKEGREVMYYVHQNRRCVQNLIPLDQTTMLIFYPMSLFTIFGPVSAFSNTQHRRIAELFEKQCNDKHDDEECSIPIQSATVPVQEKVSDWFIQEDHEIHSPEEAIFAFPDEPRLRIDNEKDQVDQYRDLVSRTSAYKWLLTTMRRELTLVTQEGDILDSIRNEISRSFPPVPKISARRQSDAVNFLFRVNWDLATFSRSKNTLEIVLWQWRRQLL